MNVQQDIYTQQKIFWNVDKCNRKNMRKPKAKAVLRK